MASQERGRPLPKFGEWDVNNPASAEGFTVIFNKARDEKKAPNSASKVASPRRNNNNNNNYNRHEEDQYRPKNKWFCCGG